MDLKRSFDINAATVLVLVGTGLWLSGGCTGFDFTQERYYCDQTHYCAAGWTCDTQKHVCVPRQSLKDIGQPDPGRDSGPGDIADMFADGEACTPNCAGKECGDDGCGGSCGKCGEHQGCKDGKCVDMPLCGNHVCDQDESCDTCPADCGCPVGRTCYDGKCCTPGATGCISAAGEDWDGDGVPNQWEMDHCKNEECKDYAIRHSEVFPEGFKLGNGKPVTHPYNKEPCCPLSLKDKTGMNVPCQCDLNCDGVIKWCDPNDHDSDGYTPAQGDCNDKDPTVYPGAPEKCGEDRACTGKKLDCTGMTDADHDGWPNTVDCNDHDPAVHPWARERCDGVDDDCNGYVDDTNPDASDQSCHTWKGKVYPDGPTCKPGVDVCLHVPQQQTKVTCMGAVGPTTEICNELDDDCDGETDEGFDLKTDINNCGKCGVACTNKHGQTQCKDGACLPVCDDGFGDCDWKPSNGCESKLSEVTQCGSCDQQTPCPDGFFCNQGICIQKYPLGHKCEWPGQCQDGTDKQPHCTDEGLCCDTLCDGPCRACVDGTCTPRQDHSMPEKAGACNGALCNANGECMKSCTTDQDCESGYICAGAAADTKHCIQPLKLGDDCTKLGAAACVSGFCQDGHCCESACDGTCKKCDSSGRCLTVKMGPDPDTCTNGKSCDALGNCKTMDGGACQRTEDCLSGACKDDYDGDGKFCASVYSCVHDGTVYNNDQVVGCIDGHHSRYCNGGVWDSKDCGSNRCVVGDNGHTYYHLIGCAEGDNHTLDYCYDRRKDPDNSQEYCAACFDATHWMGNACCGDDPGECITNPRAGGSCCYQGNVVPSDTVVGGSVLCLDGLLYACNTQPTDCPCCITSDTCTTEGLRQCCDGVWQAQDKCASQCLSSESESSSE